MPITIVNLFFCFIDLGVFILCAAVTMHLLPSNKKSPIWVKILSWLLFAALSILLPTFGKNDLLTLLVLIVCYLSMGWFLYHKSKMGLLYQLVYMMSMFATQLIGIFLVLKMYQIFGMESSLRFYLLSLFKAFFLIIVTLILKRIIKTRFVFDQQYLNIKGMLLIPLLSMALIFMYVIGGDVFFVRYGYEWLIVYCVLFLIINGYSTYFWYDVASNQRLKHRLELMTQQNESIHQYYAELEENYSQSRKIIHDIRNHIQVLEQSQKLDQTQSYFDDVHTMLNALGLRYYTDNRMLNIVLNHKLKGFKDEQVECRIGGVDLGFLSDLDITTIFSNLLDNALEACEKQDDFFILLKGEYIHDFIIVKLQNPYSGHYELGHSTKRGHDGLGLENVRQTLKRYDGELEIESQDNMFTVTLVFPGQ